MKREIKQAWIRALRSGEYKQASHVLKDETGGYCCLGVLCHINADKLGENVHEFDDRLYTYGKEESLMDFPADPVLKKLGLSRSMASELAEKNDAGASFADIATYIEEML